MSMDWLFDSRSKSVASSAKRIVADLHGELEAKTMRIAELERAVKQLQVLSTGSLENELFRLELRRKELLSELDSVDAAIVDRRFRLDAAQTELHRIIGDRTSLVPQTPVQQAQTPAPGSVLTAAINEKAAKLEEQYLEETEMFLTIRDELSSDEVLFVLHRSNDDEAVVVYTPSPNATEVVQCFRYCLFGDDAPESKKSELSSVDLFVSCGAKIVPNHDRDYPHVRELSVPSWLFEGQEGRAQLVGAAELPLVPDVIIDVWSTIPPTPGAATRFWATTSVDGVGFAVLERVLVKSASTTWGLSQQVVQVDLFGRHPASGVLLLESIFSQAKES